MASAAVVIRPARPGDVEGIVRVYLESADHHAAIDPNRYAVPESAAISARYRDSLEHPDQRDAAVTLVADRDGEILGFADVRLDRSPDPMHRDITYCHIVEIATRRSDQGRGVGAELLRAAEAWGRERGATLASLEYLAVNHRAALFYQRRGYSVAAFLATKRL